VNATPATLTLQALHESRGAEWVVEQGVQVPAHYGDPAAELGELESGCALWDGSAASRLEVLGEDRQRFLNGMTTADIQQLAPGRSCYALFTTVKGRILADATILALEDRLWVRLPPSTGAEIRQHLQNFVVADRVEILPLADMVPLNLVGPRAAERLSSWAKEELPQVPGEHRRVRVLGSEICLLDESQLGLSAFSIWISASLVKPFVAELMNRPDAPTLVGLEAMEALRISRGTPRYGMDFGPDTFPQEAGLDHGISYEKGCYLGQEVIARIHYRGGVQRVIRSLRMDGDAVPEIGEAVMHDGREAGQITSRVPTEALDRSTVLAMLALRASESGTEVSFASGATGRVIEPQESNLDVKEEE
jgi:folate-binding protein YgfZ